MMSDVLANSSVPQRWLVTGAAGFIGSHICQALLAQGQDVVGLDNLATGSLSNVGAVRATAATHETRFEFIQGDIRDPDVCRSACADVSYVLHQAALGSVPRSLAEPHQSHSANVDGFVHMVLAARDAGVKRLVYASSSSVYGDDADLPKVESRVGRPLSPYAATKKINEVYADVYAGCFGMELVGLRYFNVFGPRQDPNGPYAAVIPRWIRAMLKGEPCIINGDGSTSRDFCYVANAVQANVKAATAPLQRRAPVFNVACGATTSLLELHGYLVDGLRGLGWAPESQPRFNEFRPGDIRHSLANIAAAKEEIGYAPSHTIVDGLKETVEWYSAAARSAAQ